MTKRRRTFRSFLLIITMAGLIMAPLAGRAAVEIEGVPFAKTYRLEGAELHLRGAALLRYLVFIKAYVGAFYLLPQEDSKNALGPTPRRLELSYFHAIEASDFAEATTQKIADNVTPEVMAAIQERLATFNGLYRNVQPGDRYALTYLPGKGTELTLNDTPLGRIPGDDFAAAVFAIWLGQAPIDESFRDTLLGVR